MQRNSVLTQKIVAKSGLRPRSGDSELSVAQSAWSGAFRAICLIFGLTIGWILLFDPAVVHDTSLHGAAPHARGHL